MSRKRGWGLWDGMGFVGWKRTKSREAGMWGLKPFRGTASGIKPENSFSALSPLLPTVGCFAPHSHPSPPEKKAASRKKSRLRRKKHGYGLPDRIVDADSCRGYGCEGLGVDGMWGRWVLERVGSGQFRSIHTHRYTPIDTHSCSHARATTPYSPLFPNRISLFLTNPLFVNFPSRQSKHSSVEPALFCMSHGKKRNKIKYVGIKFGNNTKLFYLCGNFSLIVEGCKKP